MDASQRAQIASQEIERIARDQRLPLDTIQARPNREVIIIYQELGDEQSHLILAVTSGRCGDRPAPVESAG